MKKWRYDDNSLRKVYKEEGAHLKMTYKEFKKMAEQYANSLIKKVKKEIENEKVT